MEPMPNGTVRSGVADGVATVLLDRPDTMNSMNNEFMDDLRTAVERAGADEQVGVVVITGAGRGFCSGADLSAVDPEGADPEATFARLVQTGEQLRDRDGAQAIVLGCAGMADHWEALQQTLGLPVIEPVRAAVEAAIEDLAA